MPASSSRSALHLTKHQLHLQILYLFRYVHDASLQLAFIRAEIENAVPMHPMPMAVIRVLCIIHLQLRKSDIAPNPSP